MTKLTLGLKIAFYTIFGLLFLSGMVWLLLPTGNDLSESNPRSNWGPLCLKIHGAAAMGVLVIWGWFFPSHIIPNWRAGKNRQSGIVMLIVVGLLTLTGYGLYYLGDDFWRSWASQVHIIIGLLLLLLVPLHRWLGKRQS
jgi:hypothetical protein